MSPERPQLRIMGLGTKNGRRARDHCGRGPKRRQICGHTAVALLSMIIVSACSSGGGSGGSTNQAPTASAGTDQSVTEQSPVTLSGSGSDTDGSITTFLWVQTSGPGVTLNNSNAATATFTAPSLSSILVLGFRLRVTDDGGATATDTVTITVNPDPALNTSPMADAGSNSTQGEVVTVQLDGSGSNDPDGSVAAYAWSQIGGPAITINNPTAIIANIMTPDVSAPTDFVFQLEVTDNEGSTGTDTVTVTVIEPPVVLTVTGTATFDRVPHNAATSALAYNATTAAPIRVAIVQAIDATDGVTVLAGTDSDAGGDFALNVPGGTDIFIRVLAQMQQGGTPSWNFRVIDNTNAGALYALDGGIFNTGVAASVRNIHASSGWGGAGYVAPRAAAPFAVLDAIYESFILVLGVDGAIDFPPLNINWSVNNVAVVGDPAMGEIITSHYNGVEIFLLGAANMDTEEYDRHVVVHEWGHYFEDNFSRSDSIGGPHGIGDLLDFRVAMGEGFANAYSGMATGDPVYRDSFGNLQAQGFEIDLETEIDPSPGWYSESSVLAILYDIFDSNSDGVDALSMGFGPVYQVMTGAHSQTGALTSIFSFVDVLKSDFPAQAANIDSIVAARMIESVAIDEYGSMESNNAGNIDVLPVYSNIAIGGAAVSVCSIDTFGTFNKLSNSRFLRFTVNAAGNYTITATPTITPVGVNADPDMILFQAGGIVGISENLPGVEVFVIALNAGDYVLEAYEFGNLFDVLPGGRSCFDITIN